MPTKLISLELQGYKTFASRTEFAFSDKITAIVGPNGSGKSNIADAMRWVLGEQSFSLLRGKRTEDMIFSGSEQRTRAGMASATITFDNGDGWLPIDFNEVAITRRAYRDGQNEYLVNGQRVRLKDVAELLSKSGLAERTYTIIGQGLVDAALALKAEERRRLFEEAAGIGLHRSRREESVRRLDNTRRNLDRVQDILVELEPRLRSLERQARKANEFDQVAADLNVILREWYGYHWHITQKEVNDSRQVVQIQEANLEENRQKHQKASDLLNQTRLKIQDLRNQTADLHRQMSILHTNREVLSKNLAVAEEREHGLTIQVKNHDTDRARLEQEFILHQERLDSSQLEVQKFEADVAESTEKRQNIDKILKKQQEIRSQIEGEIQKIRVELGKSTAGEDNLGARKAAYLAQIQSQGETLKKIEKTLQKASQEVTQYEESTRSKELLCIKVQDECTVIDTQIEILKGEISKIELSRKKIQDNMAQIQTDITGSETQLKILLEAEKSLVGYAEGTQQLLRKLRNSKRDKPVSTLSSRLTVNEKYEVAISAALGDLIDAVMVEDQQAVDDAFTFLVDSDHRAVIIPVQKIRGKKRNDVEAQILRSEGIIGKAVDYVTPAPEIGNIVKLLLQNVYLVADRHTAEAILVDPVLQEFDQNIVFITLAGEVFHWNGVIQFGRDKKSNLLSRVRQITSIETRIKERKEAVEETKEKLENISHKMDELTLRMSDLFTQQQIKRSQLESVNHEYSQELILVQQSRRSYTWSQDQKQTVENEIAESQAVISNIEKELEKIKEVIQQLRERLRSLNQKLIEFSLDEIQEQAAHWITRCAVAERVLQDAQSRKTERLTTFNQAQAYLINLRTRQDEIYRALSILAEEKNKALEEQKQINSEIDALNKQIQPLENNLEILEEKQQILQAEEAETRQALTSAEHFFAQARISMARKQEELDNLRRRIEDDFGLVEFKYDDRISGQSPLPIEGMVEQLPVVYEISSELQENIRRYRGQLRRIGSVNPEARTEYQQVKQRYEFLVTQMADLRKAEEDVKQVIIELDLLMQRDFKHTFEAVDKEFRQVFSRLFGGGSAKLLLTDPDNIADTGIDIEARLPGRREQWLSLLSGGERSLTAAALIFALIKISPTPFCVLDEVDAMLDEVNVGRFRDLLQELSQTTQFVIVTHNRNTVQAAESIYGVTMGKDSCSQVISLKLDDVAQIVP
jgi:chromosome segregation protein